MSALHNCPEQKVCRSRGVVGRGVLGGEYAVRPDTDPFPEHAAVDFNGVVPKLWQAKSKKLQANALVRG